MINYFQGQQIQDFSIEDSMQEDKRSLAQKQRDFTYTYAKNK